MRSSFFHPTIAALVAIAHRLCTDRWAIGLVPKIRVVRVDLSSQAQVQRQRTAARRGDRLITSSACRWTIGPGRRSVQPDHRRTPKAAVPWGGSSCFPLMAPRVTAGFDVEHLLAPAEKARERKTAASVPFPTGIYCFGVIPWSCFGACSKTSRFLKPVRLSLKNHSTTNQLSTFQKN